MLTEKEITKITATSKPQIIADSKGLALWVSAYSGNLAWRYRFRWQGKATMLSLGRYEPKSHDHISLKEARQRAFELRKLLDNGNKPFAFWEADKASTMAIEHTFQKLMDVWLEKQKRELSDRYYNTLVHRVTTYLLPPLGKRDITKITKPEIIQLIKAIQDDGKIELGRRIRCYVSQAYRFAEINEWVNFNPAEGIDQALARKPKVRHNPSLKPHELPEFFAKLQTVKAEKLTKLAILFTIATAARTSETRLATRDQFVNLDGSEPLWIVPSHIMKMRNEHVQPLSPQVVHILKQAYQLNNGSDIGFPSCGTRRSKSGYMSENAMLYTLYNMNYFQKCTMHGFRGTFSTIANEEGFNKDWIELSLAHTEEDNVRASYNKALYINGRRKLMNWWSDFLVGKGADFNIA